MHSYREVYAYQWGFEEWMTMYFDVIYEAYDDSRKMIEYYLDGTKPFMKIHRLEWRYWKQFIKKIMRR